MSQSQIVVQFYSGKKSMGSHDNLRAVFRGEDLFTGGKGLAASFADGIPGSPFIKCQLIIDHVLRVGAFLLFFLIDLILHEILLLFLALQIIGEKFRPISLALCVPDPAMGKTPLIYMYKPFYVNKDRLKFSQGFLFLENTPCGFIVSLFIVFCQLLDEWKIFRVDGPDRGEMGAFSRCF
jgi:hypothetical protein